MSDHPHKPVRSFVLRQGRLTAGQQRALDTLWGRFGAEPDDAGDLTGLFGSSAPTVLEIGFGNGEALVAKAARKPDTHYLGVEVHRPGVGHCLLKAEAADISNLRVICHDAVELLERNIRPESLAEVHLLFPDPWPKKRHHKRRIIQPAFTDLVASRLVPGGLLHVATDWAPYAEHIQEVMAGSACFSSADEPPPWRPETHFEARGQRLGHANWDGVFRRTAELPGAQETL